MFDIQQGVSIAFFIKQREHSGPARVFHSDLWGLRREKYEALNAGNFEDMDWQELVPQSPSYFFVPFDYEGWREYEQGWKVTDIFPVNSVGIVTSRDKFVLDFERESLRERIARFRDRQISDDEIKQQFGLGDKVNWSLSEARTKIREEMDWEKFIQPCLYRPFDTRHLYNHSAVLERDRSDVMRHMSNENIEQMSGGGGIGLVTVRQQSQSTPWAHCGIANTIVESCYISNKTKEINYIFPLYLYPKG